MFAFMLPTFPLGYFWHLAIFADYYKALSVYRDDVIIPLGLLSMVVQGLAWAIVYERMFAGQTVARGTLGFASIAIPIAWSYAVLAVSAKHQMSSVGGYLLIETAFTLVHYAIVSPLIAIVYSRARRAEGSAQAVALG